MSPQNSIKHAIERCGLKYCAEAFFAIFIDLSPELLSKAKSEIAATVEKELPNLNDHLEFQSIDDIMHMFDLKEPEKTLPQNGILTSIYTKLALKNL